MSLQVYVLTEIGESNKKESCLVRCAACFLAEHAIFPLLRLSLSVLGRMCGAGMFYARCAAIKRASKDDVVARPTPKRIRAMVGLCVGMRIGVRLAGFTR